MPQKLKDMIKNLIDRWGWELQLIITMEQCCQLSTECSHWMRWGNNSEKIEERLADMLIMCETLKMMFRFDEDELRRIMERKLTEGLKKE
ncbi:MAG: hypothetical protein J5915_03715 [Acidaminococcaceae bacterium]|nr:hypothetical protein [Acidaminococcaceae bacterium]